MTFEERYQKFVKYLILAISIFTVVLHIGEFTFMPMVSIKFYAYHVMVALVLIFLYFPLDKKKPDASKAFHIVCHIIDWIIIGVVIAASLYVIINFDTFIVDTSYGNVNNKYIFWYGILITLVVLESARRTLGWTLPIIAVITIIYALLIHKIPGLFGGRKLNPGRIVIALFSNAGLYSTPTATCANNVFLFLMFAAFLNASGADRIFQDFAIALAGRKRGGPAKMAVLGSALFGTISGSAVANVVSTGSFTIPLMKRNGYPAASAGAIEAVASTGGQIMPPIMGAAAFVMADIAGIPYATICLGAIIPALMYYVCLFKMVDLEAVRYDIKGLDESEIPDIKKSLKRSLKLFIPIIVMLVLLLGFKMTPMVSAIYSTLAIVICGVLDRGERMTFKNIIDGCVKSGRSLCIVLSACATAGIIVGIFSITGVGLKFSNLIVQMGGSSLVFSLILSLIVCVILGMGLPTTASYIVCATVIAPALVQLGLPIFPAHLFLLFFASLACITPPVATASYAAAGIAKENPMKTGWVAFKVGITGFILPFAFVFNTEYLHFGFDFTTLVTLLSGLVVSYALAISIQGYVEKKINIFWRVVYLILGAVAITPYKVASLCAIAVFIALFVFHTITGKKSNKISAAIV
ncbi:MAG: TRAP transporter fused permease subunit [Spirochaetales bacterium]|nr:TRAP transporter fused permease subunit [Spirochaetales bacterium]